MRLLIAITLFLSFTVANAQSDLTLYHMPSLPQVSYANPANVPDANWYFGLPGASSFNTSISSNGIQIRRFNDAFVPVTGTDSFALDITKLSAMFDEDIYLNGNLKLDIVHFGARVNNTFWSFNITEKVKGRLDIPADMFHLIFEGNGGDNLGREFKFDLGLELLHTREYAIGYQQSLLNDRLRVGGKIKYLYGLNVLNQERNDVTFTTSNTDFAYNISSDLKINMASSMFEIDTTVELDERDMFYGSGNSGWGLDLGVSMDITDLITVSASIVDLGQIRWQTNAMNLQSSNPGATFEFKGIDLKEILDDSVGLDKSLEVITDSLINVFKLDSSNTSFTTGLLSEFYLGANFHITENNNVGVLFYGNYFNKTFYPAFTLSWNSRFRKIFAGSISYSLMKGNYYNIGGGFSINAGPFQYYIVSDNIFGNAYANGKNISVRTGVNFTFGRRKSEPFL